MPKYRSAKCSRGGGWVEGVVPVGGGGVVRRQLNYQCQRASAAVEAMLLSEQHGKHCKLLA